MGEREPTFMDCLPGIVSVRLTCVSPLNLPTATLSERHHHLRFPEHEIQSAETCMNLLGLNPLLGAELQFVFKSLLSAGTKI